MKNQGLISVNTKEAKMTRIDKGGRSMKSVTLELPVAELRKLRQAAAREKVSMTHLLQNWVLPHLDKLDDPAEPKPARINS